MSTPVIQLSPVYQRVSAITPDENRKPWNSWRGMEKSATEKAMGAARTNAVISLAYFKERRAPEYNSLARSWGRTINTGMKKTIVTICIT